MSLSWQVRLRFTPKECTNVKYIHLKTEYFFIGFDFKGTLIGHSQTTSNFIRIIQNTNQYRTM